MRLLSYAFGAALQRGFDGCCRLRVHSFVYMSLSRYQRLVVPDGGDCERCASPKASHADDRKRRSYCIPGCQPAFTRRSPEAVTGQSRLWPCTKLHNKAATTIHCTLIQPTPSRLQCHVLRIMDALSLFQPSCERDAPIKASHK